MAKRTIKKILVGFAVIAGIAVIGFVIYLNSLLPIITGYAAKNLCSAIFVSGRQQKAIENLDLNFSFIKFTKNTVDYDTKSVVSRFLWKKSEAVYREGFGVTLLRDIKKQDLLAKHFPAGGELTFSQDTAKWPLGNIMPAISSGTDTGALKIIAKNLIREHLYNGNVFAFMVIHKGIPVIESYAPEFTSSTRFLSWSMGKSFVNALVGVMVNQNRIDINKPVDLPEWKGDSRAGITVADLMQMQSGLEWNEDYGNRSDVTLMLHCQSDFAHYAIDKKLDYKPGTHWYYSSGTTNIVSYLIRKQFGNDSLYYLFVKKDLFNKLGMPDAVFETDASGTIVGSSYLYATARDYARFGMMFLNDGVFNGERILPEGWVKMTTTPASDSKGGYGSFFWLNEDKVLKDVPSNAYLCEGHDGQFICIIPDRQLVVVLLGYSPKSKGGLDLNLIVKDVLQTVKQ
jgi:CubicO group peptidase (beta-lactamase class C family)